MSFNEWMKDWEGIDLENFNVFEYIEKYNDVEIKGYHVLLLVFKPKIITKSTGGIHLTEKMQVKEGEYASPIGLVLKLGSDAYKGDCFPEGPWVKPGDWVIFNRIRGMQIRRGQEPLLLIEDKHLNMVISDPLEYSK
jgi:co-chaperonin GroES (HSP10)